VNVEGSGDVTIATVKQQSVRSSLIDASYSQRSSHQSSPLTVDTCNGSTPGSGSVRGNDSVPDISNDLSQYSDSVVISNETVVNDSKKLLGHKRSRSSTLDMPSQLQQFDATKHRRSKSFDVNFHVAVVDPPQSNGIGEGTQDEIDGQGQEHVLLEDEVDFSAMFGRWKGNIMLESISFL